ncbi:MAG: pyruvate formate lyase family protein [Eubacteriales bacterium]
MSKIQFINYYPAEQSFTYDERIAMLRSLKVEQTAEKAALGGADEDDYGVIVQDEFDFKLEPNHENGSIYGYEAWSSNYCRLLDSHPIYVNPLDAFIGKGFLFMERLRPKACKWNPKYAYDDLAEVFEKYNIISGIDNCHHFTPDLAIGMKLGWGGILEKLKAEKLRHDDSHARFYDSEIAVVEAMIRFVERAADTLLALSAEEKNHQLSQNLAEMAEINKKVAAGVPQTFREAIQWMCHFSMFSRTYNRGSAGGQLDELIRPYYERDVKLGILDDEEAVFELACLFLQDSRYYQLAGPDENGNDMTSKISYLCLDAADKLNLACNLTVRFHDGIDREFYRKSVAYLFKNKQGWPRYSSDSALSEGFMKCGYPASLARRRVAAGCHWMCIPGCEYTMNDTVKINLAKVFEVAFDEMYSEKIQSTDRLFEIYEKHLKKAVEATAAGIMHHLKYQTESQPELILNLLMHGLIEKGVNVTDGGAKYYNMCVDGSGIAVAADSFGAIEQRIEKEKRLDYASLRRLIDDNFQGEDGEYYRRLLNNSEKYGGGDTISDKWAVRISQLYTRLVREQNMRFSGQGPNGKVNFIPGLFSWSNTIFFGKALGATPNGRRAGEPINHGANPCGNFRRDGAVSAMCNSIAAVQPGYGNTAPVQLEFDPAIACDDEGIDKMAAMIETIMTTGNTLLNINIIDADRILEADRDPSKFPDLVVRVTGFTAFFAMLSPEFRKLVVDRVRSVNPGRINYIKQESEKENGRDK